jgi:hypothetical protein
VNSWLSLFSDWTLALLPRLFIYPGGLWALAALLGLRLVCGGLRGAAPALMLADLARSPAAAATAWAALALLPLPGAAPLPFPADRFTLAGLMLVSLALDLPSVNLREERAAVHASAGIGLTLAVMAPLAGGRALLGDTGGVSSWLSLAAAAVGLAGLAATSSSAASGIRWLGWLGLAVAPVLDYAGLSLPGVAWTSLVYGASILLVAGASRPAPVRGRPRALATTCWGLAGLAMLAALASPGS